MFIKFAGVVRSAVFTRSAALVGLCEPLPLPYIDSKTTTTADNNKNNGATLSVCVLPPTGAGQEPRGTRDGHLCGFGEGDQSGISR